MSKGYIRNSVAVVDSISSTGIDTLSQGSLVHIVNGGGASLYSLNKDVTSPSMTVEQAIENGSLGTLHTETFQVTNTVGITNSDSDVKSCRLLDFEGKQGFHSSEFILHITREPNNYELVAKIKAIYLRNKLEVYVSDVVCTSYTLSSNYNVVFRPESIFKDTALIGCILSVEQGDKLILNLLNMGIGYGTTTTIETKYISGNTFPHPAEYHRSYTYFNNYSNINIPFKDGASNVFNNCGQIYTFFSKPTSEYIFRNGLYKLGSSGSVNQFIYPSLQKVTGENSIYEVNNRYLVQDNSNRYISQSLPNIKGKVGEYSDDNLDACIQMNGVPTREGQGAFRIEYRRWGGANLANLNYSTAKISFDASRSSSVYRDGASVKPNSVQVQYYIKLF